MRAMSQGLEATNQMSLISIPISNSCDSKSDKAEQIFTFCRQYGRNRLLFIRLGVLILKISVKNLQYSQLFVAP